MTKRTRVVLIITACMALLAFIGVRLANSFLLPRHVLGVVDGRLAACPDRPNCVSSQADDADHHIEPLLVTSSPEDALQRLTTVIESMPRARIVSANDGYLHAEFRSLLLAFVDDVEFVVDEAAQVIHCRSASRVGHSDLGVNRKRMEAIRARYQSTERN